MMQAALLAWFLAFNYAGQVGIAVVRPGDACLYVNNGSLAPGARISLVPVAPPQTISEAEVVRKAGAQCPALPGAGSDRHHYAIRVVKGSVEPGQPMFAIAGFGGAFGSRGGVASADLDADGTREFFRSCASAEGLHLTIWSGSPLTGTLKWHDYYYAGYDLEVNCTQREMNAP